MQAKYINKKIYPFLNCPTTGDVINNITQNTASDLTILIDGMIVPDTTLIQNNKLASIGSKTTIYKEFLASFCNQRNMQEICYFQEQIQQIIEFSCNAKGELNDLRKKEQQLNLDIYQAQQQINKKKFQFSELFDDERNYKKELNKTILKQKLRKNYKKFMSLKSPQVDQFLQIFN